MEEPRTTDVIYGLTPEVHNPFPVYISEGDKKRLVGAAVVTLVKDGFQVRLIIDPHSPEAFDLVNEPNRCHVDLRAHLTNRLLYGEVFLSSK